MLESFEENLKVGIREEPRITEQARTLPRIMRMDLTIDQSINRSICMYVCMYVCLPLVCSN